MQNIPVPVFDTWGDPKETGNVLWWAGPLSYMLPPLDASCGDLSALVCRLASLSEVVVPRSKLFC